MRFPLLALFALFSAHLISQSSPIISLGVEQGLSNEHVLSITQDKDGFVWFATEEGLNKFDGLRFTHFYKHNNDLSGNELNCVYADPEEPIIWIATQRDGLNAYNYEKDSLEVFIYNPKQSNSLITNDVTSIARASDGNLWLSTYHRGVEYFNKDKRVFTHYNSETLHGFPSDNVWTLMDDNEGNLYIGHVTHGLTVLSLKSNLVRNYMHDPSDPESIPGNEVRRIYKDSHNNIWVGTDRGLALFNSDSEIFLKPDGSQDSPLRSAIFDVRQTDDNKLWIATELNGVFVIDLKQHFFTASNKLGMQHYTVGYNRYSLSNSTVRCVFQDSFRNIWLGTYGGGINFISHVPPLFNKFSFSPIQDDSYSLNNRSALSLSLDGDKKLWIGTDGGGINVFDNGKRVKVYSKETGDLSHNTVHAILKDSSDNIWVGTFNNGVHYYDHYTRKFTPLPLNGKDDYDVRCFYEDHKGDVWIGTSNGIFVMNGDNREQIRYYSTENSKLPEKLVRCIGQDVDGRMWIGTFGGGLAVYTQHMEPIQYLNEYNGFCSNTINAIFNDSQGRVWVATGEGLVCFDQSDSLKYRLFSLDEGLINNYIRAITEDKNGNIWFSSNAGISCFLAENEQFQHYKHNGKTPMSGFVSAVIKDNENEIIYFGSINGVYFFEPFEVLREREIPPAIVTEMRIYEAQALQGETLTINYFNKNNNQIKLTHKQNTFSLFFNVQDYAFVDEVNYFYRLKGVDELWQPVEGNNLIFRNMPPGLYQFEIITHMNNHHWGSNIYAISILIKPPIWLTWWAKAIYFLLLACIMYAFFYIYRKRLFIQSSYEIEKKNHAHEQELNDERLRFYTNITHELRTPLTLILGPIEDLQRDTVLLPKQHHKISVVRLNALRLLDLINQLLEFRKTETQNKKLCVSKGNIATLVNEVGLKYKELVSKPGVAFSIKAESEYMPLYFDKEIVNTILDNLLSNAFKYTDNGTITLSLYTYEKNNVSFTGIKVDDTGYGIPKEEQENIFDHYYQVKNNKQASGTGIGLALVKNLTLLHEGEIIVESELHKGSSFRFSLLTQNYYPNALHNDETEVVHIDGLDEINEENEESLSNGKPILLVVEDNKDIRDYIADSFSDSFEVITANEGEEGCKVAFSQIPDIIVSDILMPGMDGITFCQLVKEDMRTCHIPVILLTAKISIEDKEQGYISGADSYLTKPFSATLLRSRIYNLLDTRKKLAEQFKLSLKLDDKSDLFNKSVNQLDNEFIANVTGLIEDNLEQEKIDVGYLSDKLSMSSSTLYRKIKALTGMSTNEFIRKIKINHAEQLLLTGKYTVSEVAYRVGMNSPVYFRQCFKDEFGLVPSDYLKKIKAE